jgi:hypothetical protein
MNPDHPLSNFLGFGKLEDGIYIEMPIPIPIPI